MFDKVKFCPLFVGISEEDIESIGRQIHYQVKKYEAGELIISAGDECNNLLIVLEGSVRGEMMDENGKTIKIEDIEACKPLAPAFLFGKNNYYPVTIVTNKNSQILVLSKDTVIKVLQMNDLFLKNYMDNISSRAQFLSQKLKFLSFQSIKGKFAHFILQTAGDRFKTIELKKNQSELAELFGVTRPALARVIRELNNDGIIEARGKQITILDKPRLIGMLKS
ncbi:MAG: Crp/Fnr family transcriptional regulator [Bacteroidales bacterium]|nr:Crp/Fnr family transcriptional regulator [Bacteroidales bacterium]